MRLKDKVAIITGGSRGIGRAICVRFAKEGAKVIINYYKGADEKDHEHSAGELKKGIDSFGGDCEIFEADVADRAKMREMVKFAVEKYGRLDIFVANAGICPFEEFLKIDEELLERTMAVNFKGAFYGSQTALQQMVEQQIKGRIIFISSVSSIFGGELQAHYCATKGAVNQLMKSIAITAGKYGITSNAVLPGTVITDINRKELEADRDLLNYFVERTPMGRLCTPEDIAAAVLFYASEDADRISGTTLIVDGGMSVNLQ